MPSIFTRIIDGEIPARFVWKDDVAVAFLDVAPITPGHTLVVSRAEIDHWIHLPEDTAAHLMRVAHAVGKAQELAFGRKRVAVMIAGMAVPHTHVHVFPIDREDQMRFSLADRNPDQAMMDGAAEAIRNELRTMGYDQVHP